MGFRRSLVRIQSPRHVGSLTPVVSGPFFLSGLPLTASVFSASATEVQFHLREVVRRRPRSVEGDVVLARHLGGPEDRSLTVIVADHALALLACPLGANDWLSSLSRNQLAQDFSFFPAILRVGGENSVQEFRSSRLQPVPSSPGK